MLDELTNGGPPADTTPMPGKQRRKRRTRRIVAIVIALVTLLAVGSGAAYLGFLNHQLTNVRHEALLPIADAAPGAKQGVGGTAPKPVPASALGAQNILVIGSDSRGAISDGRSDVIVLVHIMADHKRIYLVHFPRDMYVDVPGHGKDKINAAYAYGGAPLLVSTLQGLVDIKIDHVAIMGFEGFKAMTDAIGGVDVFAEEASGGPGHITVHVGMNHLDGDGALDFVRERYQLSEGDISRGRRQQAFLRAMILKGLSDEVMNNPVRFAQFFAAANRNMIVDNGFSVDQLREQAMAMRGMRSSNIYFVAAPLKGFGTSPSGASIDIVDYDKLAKLSNGLRLDDMTGVRLN